MAGLPAEILGKLTPHQEHWRREARKSAKKHGVDPDKYERLIYQESRFHPYAKSHAGARGIAQIMPGTAAQPGFKVAPITLRDTYNPAAALDFGARYFKQLLNRVDGDYKLAAAAYNAGLGTVRKAGNRVPSIKETQNYAQLVSGEKEFDLKGSAQLARQFIAPEADLVKILGEEADRRNPTLPKEQKAEANPLAPPKVKVDAKPAPPPKVEAKPAPPPEVEAKSAPPLKVEAKPAPTGGEAKPKVQVQVPASTPATALRAPAPAVAPPTSIPRVVLKRTQAPMPSMRPLKPAPPLDTTSTLVAPPATTRAPPSNSAQRIARTSGLKLLDLNEALKGIL